MRLLIKRKYKLAQIAQLLLLFFVSLNFKNLYFYLIFLTFFVCLLANIKQFKIDAVSICLALLSVCYILFYPPTRDSITTILKQFAFPMCYLIGLNLFDANNNNMIKEKSNADDQLKLSIIVVAFGTLLHYLLNASINIGSLLRNTVDYWTGDVVSATDQALLAIIAICVFSIWLFGDYSVWKRLIASLGLVLIFAYNFVLAGRTILLMSAIIMCVAFLFIRKHINPDAQIKSYLFVFGIVLTALLLVLNNVGGMRDWIMNSNFSQRFETQEIVEDIRFERKISYVIHMIKFPFGGGALKAYVGGYAHELYLDVFSDVGIVGYLLVIAVVVITVINVIKFIKMKDFAIDTKAMVLCVFMGINIVFFLEPILQGEPWFFCVFCFLSGALRKNLLIKKQIEQEWS